MDCFTGRDREGTGEPRKVDENVEQDEIQQQGDEGKDQ